MENSNIKETLNEFEQTQIHYVDAGATEEGNTLIFHQVIHQALKENKFQIYDWELYDYPELDSQTKSLILEAKEKLTLVARKVYDSIYKAILSPDDIQELYRYAWQIRKPSLTSFTKIMRKEELDETLNLFSDRFIIKSNSEQCEVSDGKNIVLRSVNSGDMWVSMLTNSNLVTWKPDQSIEVKNGN